jgi:hypothetical protein
MSLVEGGPIRPEEIELKRWELTAPKSVRTGSRNIPGRSGAFIVVGILALLSGCTTNPQSSSIHRGRSSTAVSAAQIGNEYVGLAPGISGLVVFSSTNGHRIRLDSTDPRDAYPELPGTGQSLYFARSTFGCDWTILRQSINGGPATALLSSLPNGNVFAVSPDGMLLAYEVTPGGCSTAQPPALYILDLHTRRRHSIRDVPEFGALAWSSTGRELFVQVSARDESAVIHTILNPLTAASFALGKVGSEPCPSRAIRCAQYDPTSIATGQLFYVAVIDPDPRQPCTISVCLRQTYVLTQTTDGKATALMSTEGPPGEVPYLAVNKSGDEAALTVPSGTFIWQRGGKTIDASPVVEQAW